MARPVSDSVPLLPDDHNAEDVRDQAINGLVQGGSWTFDGGPRVLTYSFDLNFDGPKQRWSSAWMNAVDKAFDAWEAVANVRFRRVGTANAREQHESTADIALALSPGPGQGLAALGIFPDPDYADLLLQSLGYSRTGGAFPAPRPEGDITINNRHFAFKNLAPGNAGFYVLLHEIGHALGLKHATDKGGNDRPTFNRLSLGELYEKPPFTVMSGEYFPDSGIPSTPGLFDVLAIQHIYGANMSYRTGDNTYSLEGARRIIWDAGGEDTFSARGWDSRVSINLFEGAGAASSITGPLKLTIAYGVTIENAIGGNDNDRILGNDADNRIDGAAGRDILEGRKGNDTYIVESSRDLVREFTDGGNDTIRSSVTLSLPENVENLGLTGKASTEGVGNDLANRLAGNKGDNLLDGKGGDDSLDGAGGKDTLIGGDGSDTYIVDDGLDLIIERPRGHVQFIGEDIDFYVEIDNIDFSSDGRYFVFGTSNIGATPGDGSTDTDLLVQDLQTGELIPVSVDVDGGDVMNDVDQPTFLTDSRYVVFSSRASDMVAGDTNNSGDVFIRDLEEGTTIRISLTADGSQIDDGVAGYSISPDGKYLAFSSWSDTLTPGDENFFPDVYVKNRETGAVTLVSHDPDGFAVGGDNMEMAADGRYVLFRASERVLGEGSSLRTEVYVKDLDTGQITWVSRAASGAAGNGAHGFATSISADGRYVVFSSDASNLVAGDTNGMTDVFLRDLQEDTLVRISTTSDGSQAGGFPVSHRQDPMISADGRFVVFSSLATNLVPGDTNGYGDVFVKDIDTGAIARVSLNDEGEQAVNADSFGLSISDDGRYIIFRSSAVNLLPNGVSPFGGYAFRALNPLIDDNPSVRGDDDAVISSISYELPDLVEDLALAGDAPNDGTGNHLPNLIKGNGAANTLDGAAGEDTLKGGGGNDTLVHDAGDALVDGGDGTDTLRVSGDLDLAAIGDEILVDIEQIDLAADAGANILKLAETDVLEMCNGPLTVLGDSADTVDIDGDFIADPSDDGSDGFLTFAIGTATLLIDTDITVV